VLQSASPTSAFFLQWFLVAKCIGDAATSSVFLLAITFLTDVLNFSAAQNEVAMAVLFIACIPGGLCSYWCSKQYNLVASSIVAISILLTNTALVAGILQGPDQEISA
jgi:sugar phosphate permease